MKTTTGVKVEDGFDARVFRDTLGHFASGITIVSALADDDPIGFTCQSFYSVSTEPPLVSFSVMADSLAYPRMRETGKFLINVLAHDQRAVSNVFALRGADKWADIDWSLTENRNPIIANTLMWLDCDIWAEHEAGDHHIVIGRVREVSPAGWHDHGPLLYFRGQYRHLSDLDS